LQMSTLTNISSMHLPEDEQLADPDDDGQLGPDHEALLVEEALRKTPAQRTIDDCEVLQRATAGVKFFRAMSDSSQVLGLCRVMTVQRFAKDEHIVNQGDVGTTFYVVFSGSVKVFVNDYKSGKEGLGSCVATLDVGDAFGELALVGDGKRAATCVCSGPTQLLCIEKDAYESACAQSYHEKISNHVDFLRSIFLFSRWSDDELTALAKVLTKKSYGKASTIIRQGSSTDCMYFVYSGRCRVLRQLDLSRSLTDKLTTSLFETRSSESASLMEHGAPLSLQADAPLLEIGKLGRHQYFGEVALLEGQKHGKKKWSHAASVVSLTKVEILVLSKYDFYHHINETTQELMRQYADKFYYDDDKIRQSISKQHKWDTYKQELLSGRGSPTRGGRTSARR